MNGIEIIFNALTLLGTIGSLIGVWMGWEQIKKIKTANEATKIAIEETNKEIQNNNIKEDISYSVTTIDHIIEYVLNKEFKIAYVHLRYLQERIIELYELAIENKIFKIESLKQNLEEKIRILGIDIFNLQNAKEANDLHSINSSLLRENLNNLKITLTHLKSRLNFHLQ